MRPPEINSGQMYSGPGSGSMMAASVAWSGLSANLYDLAADYGTVTTKLAGGWQSPAATAMSQTATNYLGWLTTAAAQAQQAATHAETAASAFDTAVAAMVPPPMIDENRTLTELLAATNCLGQISPDIADADADYEEMWAQDADVMYAYAGASADASTVTPFSSPPAAAGPAGQDAALGTASGSWALQAAPDVISAGYQVMSIIPEALEAMALLPTTFDKCLAPATISLSKLSSLGAPLDFALNHLNSLNKAAALQTLLPGGASDVTVTARFGRRNVIGTLSVPRAWGQLATPAPAIVQPLGKGWVCERVVPPEEVEPPRWPSSR